MKIRITDNHGTYIEVSQGELVEHSEQIGFPVDPDLERPALIEALREEFPGADIEDARET